MNWNKSWRDVRTAQAQADNAKREMQHWKRYDVYKVFVDIARDLNRTQPLNLIDIGCGAGQYSDLWRYGGGALYCGCDHPRAIHLARENYKHDNYSFSSECDLTDVWNDVALSACSIEYAEYPPAELYNILQTFAGTWVILHRLRFHDDHGKFVVEGSWGAIDRYLWRWNAEELDILLEPYKVEKYNWDGGRQWTYVITK